MKRNYSNNGRYFTITLYLLYKSLDFDWFLFDIFYF